jgi:hypothetical protein
MTRNCPRSDAATLIQLWLTRRRGAGHVYKFRGMSKFRAVHWLWCWPARLSLSVIPHECSHETEERSDMFV